MDDCMEGNPMDVIKSSGVLAWGFEVFMEPDGSWFEPIGEILHSAACPMYLN